VKKCSAWAVKSIWKRDFQPHEQASVFETIYEVSLFVIVQIPLPADCMSGLHAAWPCLGCINSTQTWKLHRWKTIAWLHAVAIKRHDEVIVLLR
jgi:hypothetical protein